MVVNKSHEKLLFVIAARCNNIGYKNKMYMNDCVDNLFIDPNKLHFSTFFAFLSTICIYIPYYLILYRLNVNTVEISFMISKRIDSA